MKKEIWVVAANSSEARFFKLAKGLHLDEFETFINVDSRLADREIGIHGFPGSNVYPFTATGQRGGVIGKKVTQSDPKQVEAIQFAKRVADYLNNARAKGTLEKLYLVSSPAFLGHLRHELDDHTRQLIANEVSKDIASFEPDEIIKYFPIG